VWYCVLYCTYLHQMIVLTARPMTDAVEFMYDQSRIVVHGNNGHERRAVAPRYVMFVIIRVCTCPQRKRQVSCARVNNCFVCVDHDGGVLRSYDDRHRRREIDLQTQRFIRDCILRKSGPFALLGHFYCDDVDVDLIILIYELNLQLGRPTCVPKQG